MKKVIISLLVSILSLSFIPPSNAWDNWESGVLLIKGKCLNQEALYTATDPIRFRQLDLSEGKIDIMEKISYAYPLAGESYRADNIMSLLKKYGKDEKIPKYSETGLIDTDPYKVYITKATLIPESKNKFDKFAVKVLVKGKHVGYIPEAFSYAVSLMMHKNKNKSLTVKACLSHYPGGWGPQVTLDLPASFLGEDYADEVRVMEGWFNYNNFMEYGPGTKCTKYFSKWYCGPLEFDPEPISKKPAGDLVLEIDATITVRAP